MKPVRLDWKHIHEVNFGSGNIAQGPGSSFLLRFDTQPRFQGLPSLAIYLSLYICPASLRTSGLIHHFKRNINWGKASFDHVPHIQDTFFSLTDGFLSRLRVLCLWYSQHL